MAEDGEHHDVHFESADAGASLTYPQQAGTVRKNGFLVIKGRPCKVSVSGVSDRIRTAESLFCAAAAVLTQTAGNSVSLAADRWPTFPPRRLASTATPSVTSWPSTYSQAKSMRT